MPRKYSRKNKKIRGGDEPIPPQSKAWYDFSDSVPAMPAMPAMPDLGLSSYNPFASKEEKPAYPPYPTEGGKKRRRRRRMRGGAYSPNSSSYGADAAPYSGPPTARAQAYVGGRKATKKRRGSRRR